MRVCKRQNRTRKSPVVACDDKSSKYWSVVLSVA